MVLGSGIAGGALVFALIFGYVQVSRPISGETIKVAVVQGNIEQAKKWDKRYAGMIMKTYTELSQQAANGNPMLIVWPETATPKAINIDQEVFRNVKRIVEETSSNVVLGSSQQQKWASRESYKTQYTNSAFLIAPPGRSPEFQRYDKIILLPFSEYLPMKDVIPWSWIQVPNFAGYKAGDKFTVFRLGDVQFGVTICWENIFPELVRELVKKVDSLSSTSRTRPGSTKMPPYQFLSMSVFGLLKTAFSLCALQTPASRVSLTLAAEWLIVLRILMVAIFSSREC